MSQEKIAIIGAGMCGAACARRLAAAGVASVQFDKGRGIGGRLATRRTPEGRQFDHGAQYVTARREGFAAFLAEAETAGAAAPWRYQDRDVFVGAPGMNGLVKHAAVGLDVRQQRQVRAIEAEAGGWRLDFEDGAERFDRVVVTAPAPQTATLLAVVPDLARKIATVELAPCVTLMAAFAKTQAALEARRDPEAALSWVARDSSKPGRDGAAENWVAQASPAWSAAHLEEAPDDLVTRMVPMLADEIDASAQDLLFATAHRWRYAAVTKPLGRPFAQNAEGTLFAGGDWCLEARVEAAWESGVAIAETILQR